MHTMKRIVTTLALLAVSLGAWAQPPLDVKAYHEQEKRWQSCPDGYYDGPRPGRKSYSHDRYLWVVTPAFARRFCMPEHMIDPELKGAEAIAFKRMPSDDGHDRCVVEDGQPRCSEDNVARFEIYLRSDLKLPAAQPEVRFYEAGTHSSSLHISRNIEQLKKKLAAICPEFKEGIYIPPPGTVPRFGRFCGGGDPGYGFALISTWRKRETRSIVDSLWEVGWRADVAPGLDLLLLEARGLGGEIDFLAKHPRAVEWGGMDRFAIVLADYRPGAKPHDQKRFPEDYSHVIYLPDRFMSQVRASLEATGGWKEFLRTFRQP